MAHDSGYMDKYFAQNESEECVKYLHQKAQVWYDNLLTNRYLEKVKSSWDSYHGVYFEEAHEINFGGEKGENVNIAVNHYRNLARHMLNMVTATRPSFKTRAVNTDSRSQIQTKLANGLLEYYMREKRLEVHLKTAVEYAIVLGTGYIKMEWNAQSGEIHDVIEPEPVFDADIEIEYDQNGEYIIDEEGNYLTVDGDYVSPKVDDDGNLLDEDDKIKKPFYIQEGDVQFKNLSPFDVVFDSTKESYLDHDWVICRSFKNKFDLIQKFPDLEDEILALETKSDLNGQKVSLSPYDETVDIPVYEFFHKQSESMPDGRYILYLDEDVILMDTPMPYRKLPVYRITPSDMLGTSYGYSGMFDLLPLQEACNTLYSTILTNQATFGVQNILNPRGNDVKYTQVNGSLNFVEFDAVPGDRMGGEPRALQLTATAPEIFQYLQMVEKAMETISGVNSVARGNPESSLKSGNALALVQSQALQFMSGLQQSYIMLIEDLGTGLIKLLQDFAEVPRVAEIAGLSNKTKMVEFSSKDIDKIQRVIVDVGNALSQSTSGRVQMADNLLQMGLITTPEDYISIINTGNLDVMTDQIFDENVLIQDENENLISGEMPVQAIITENHDLHIRKHKAVLSSVEAKNDPELVARVLAHIQEHMDLLRTQPDLLAILGEQALSPQGGSPVSAQGAQQMQGGVPPEMMMDPVQAGQAAQMGPNAQMPSMPNIPTDPNTGGSLLPTERGLG